MGVKERNLGDSTYPAVPAWVGFGLWLLPSCHSFGLRTGEVKLLFWFDLGGREALRAATSHRAFGSPACSILAVACGEETLARALVVNSVSAKEVPGQGGL